MNIYIDTILNISSLESKCWWNLITCLSISKELKRLKNEKNEALEKIKEIHYNRNNYLNIPKNINLINYENLWYYRESKVKSELHQFWINDKSNIKIMSKDKRQEIIFDKFWNIDKTDENIWTYNFWTNESDHVILDVIPYILFWNTQNDSTTYRERRNLSIMSIPNALLIKKYTN